MCIRDSDGKVAGRHANEEHSGTGDFDGDFKIVLGTAEDAEVSVIVRAPETDGEVTGVVCISPVKVDGDLIAVAPDDPEFTGALVQTQIAPGGEVDREGVILKVFDLEFGAGQTLWY